MADLPEVLIDLSLITFPVPEPYDKTQPEKQRENLAFVGLQILEQFKTQGVKVSSRALDGSLPQAVQDLQYEGVILDMGNIKVIKTRKNTGVYET